MQKDSLNTEEKLEIIKYFERIKRREKPTETISEMLELAS